MRWKFGLVVLVFLLGVSGIGGEQSVTEAQSPGGIVAFIGSDDLGNADIYLLNLGSGQVVPLGVDVTPEADLDWQPEGNKLAFTTAGGGYGVLDGLAGCFGGGCQDVETFMPEEAIAGVEWAPDGAWLLLHTDENIRMVPPLAQSFSLAWTINLTCSNGFEVSAPEPFLVCAYPDTGTAGLINLYRIGDPIGTDVQLELLNELGAYPDITTLAIGPEGEVAVGTQEAVGDSGHVMDAAGSVGRIADMQVHIYDLAFAPDGARIAVAGATADSTGDGTLRDGDAAELWMYNMNTSQMQQVAGYTGATDVAWAPGGDALLMVIEHQRFAFNNMTPPAITLPPNLTISSPEWSPVEGMAALPGVPTATPRDGTGTGPGPGPGPGATPIPTVTPYPTFTPYPTLTPFPTVTPRPSKTPGSPMGTGCEYAYAGGGGLPVAIGDTAEVTSWGAGLRLRAAAGLTQTQLRELRSGARMEVLNGPTCATGYRWWQVRLESDGTVGWVADSDPNGWWIETASPTAPPPDEVSINLTAERNTINNGECVEISWNVTGIKEVYYLGDGSGPEEGVTGTGSRLECPATTTTYSIKVIKQDNSIVYPEVTVNVVNAPPNVTINASQTFVPIGGCVTISWSIVGYDYRDFILSGPFGDATISGQTGSINECPPLGSHTYMLTLDQPISPMWPVTVNVFEPI
jgi:hypothetical protein